MDEQSHKHEMRAALRGDFERLRARREGRSDTVLQPAAEQVPMSTAAPAAETDRPRGSWLERLRERR